MAKKPVRRGHGEGSIYQRKGDGRFVGSFKTDDGKRKYVYAETQREALEKLRKAQREHEKGTLVSGSHQTLKQYLEYWLENTHKPPMVRLGTYEMYRTILNKHLIPALGHIPIQRLSTQQVQSFYAAKLKEGLSAQRVRKIHSVLRKALDHAVHIPLVSRNVCDTVELPRKEQIERQTLTPEQAKTLLQAVRAHRLDALLTVALATGMRKGELLGLRWQDIDFKRSSLQIRRTVSYITGHGFVEGEPKTAKSKRKITLPQFAVETLKRHRTLQLEARLKAGAAWSEHDLVFCNSFGGFLHPMIVFRLFSKALKDAGLPSIRFHDLRHSAATLLLSMGVNIKVIQELLGHSTVSMTLGTYSHTLPSMQQEAMEKMDNLFRVDEQRDDRDNQKGEG